MKQKPAKSMIPEKAILEALRRECLNLPSIDLTHEQIATLELIINGALSPLDGYPDSSTSAHIQKHRRLPSGTFCPFAPNLNISNNITESLQPGQQIALRHPEGMVLAILDISEIRHNESDTLSLAGKIKGIELPPHPVFKTNHQPPESLHSQLEPEKSTIALWASTVLSNQDTNALKKNLADQNTQIIIFHACALEHNPSNWQIARVRALLRTIELLPENTTRLCLVPPLPDDNILLKAQVAANYGCSQIITSGENYKTLLRHCGLIEIKPLESKIQPHPDQESLLIQKVQSGEKIAEDVYPPATISEIRHSFPPPPLQGFALFFTGLSGSGKSTVANAVNARLIESGKRRVTLLDGDIVRKNLSSELTFTREHRDLNIQRIGFVASQIVKNHGIAICAPIAPYQNIRREVRKNIERYGRFIEIYISTPLEVCEKRDRKGLYAKARQGLIKNFTGIDDPYETPENAEIEIDTSATPLEQAADIVLEYLKENKLID